MQVSCLRLVTDVPGLSEGKDSIIEEDLVGGGGR